MENIKFYDAKRAPFTLYGYFKEPHTFKRIDEKRLLPISKNLAEIGKMSSGLRIHFITNSTVIHLKVKEKYNAFSHMPLTGVSGFDLYRKKGKTYTYIKSFIPPLNFTDGFISIAKDLEAKPTEYVLYLPLYNEVLDLEIGLERGAILKEGTKYSFPGQVVFYGSSITQGGCASRPGNSYPAILSREFDFDFVNLGFSGSCFGEQEMAKLISEAPGTIFVLDYDHNAHSIVELKATHLAFFETIRKVHKNLPVIIMSKPIFIPSTLDTRRKELIKETYTTFKNKRDNNVYFVDGSTFFPKNMKESATVDGAHPNDLGFWFMKEALVKPLETIIKNMKQEK